MDKNGKIFSIVAVEPKDFGTGVEDYFVLKPSFKYDFNPGYMAYIPVSRSENLLKNIMNKEEALSLIDSLPSLEPYLDISPRDRRMFFTKVIATGERKDVMRVIKSLIYYRDERKRLNKPFSDFDRRLLDSLKVMVNNELSISLEIAPDSVGSFIYDRVGYSI